MKPKDNLRSAAEHLARSMPVRTAVLAFAYVVSGWLGILLAIPPGYATAIFPASGVALAALLTGGIRLWPGVWLGSFLLNTAIALASPAGLQSASLAVAALIGLGATLQAVAGTLLVRRLAPGHALLDEGRHVLGFIAAGGLLACTVSPLIGVGTLWKAGIIAGENAAYSLWTWWVGDAMGVLIVAPLALILLRRDEAIWRRRVVPMAVPAAVALAVIIAIFLQASRAEQRRIESEFRETTTALGEGLREAMRNYTQATASVRRFTEANPGLSRAGFASFVTDVLADFPGMQALEWAPRVAASERAGVEARAHREGFAGFRIVERDRDGRVVEAGSREEYFPVYYVEPHQGNESALGFDLASNEARRRGLETARDMGRMTGTPPIRLLQGETGLLLVAPVYGPGAVPGTVAERRRELAGFALGVLRLGAIADHAFKKLDRSALFAAIDDVTPGEERKTLYRSLEDPEPVRPALSTRMPLEFASRNWEVRLSALPGYIAARRSLESWVVLAGGLLFVGLLQAHLLSLTGQNSRVRRMIEERTAALEDEIHERERVQEGLRVSEERTQGIVNVVAEGIVTIDGRGIIQSVNPAVERLFGWTAQELLGRNVSTLMPDPPASDHDRFLRRYLDGGQAAIIGIGREIVGKRKDGSTFPAHLHVAELKLGDGPVFVGSLRDISGRKRAEQALVEANRQLLDTVALLERQRGEILQLNEMGDILQICRSADEACEAVALYLQKLLPHMSGFLALRRGDGEPLQVAAHWGEAPGVSTLEEQDCWGIRRGRAHRVDAAGGHVACAHLPQAGGRSYICVPLVTQGKLMGLLHLAPPAGDAGLDDGAAQLAQTAAETIALTLANLQLRQSLREQAIRDPLTGLYNRRHMEDALEREMAQARRHGRPVGVMIMDLDHFKRFNDTHGHAAGDKVLREFGNRLRACTRQGDILCRYGGEEFVLIMPDSPAAATRARAEDIRRQTRQIDVTHEGAPVGGLTVSIGIAQAPDDGDMPGLLLRLADQALYLAKAGGRDRVVAAAGMPRAEPPASPGDPAHRTRTSAAPDAAVS